MGCYFPKTVDPSKHELTLLKEYKGMRVYNQKNLHKGTEMIVAVLSRIMIIDIDDKTLEETIYLLKQKPQLNFKVYKTTKGYHAYCINNYFSHKDLKTLQTMKDCGCDEIYIHFCNEYGFVTRMSKKTLNETYIEKFECYVINDEENRSIKGIEDIVNLKDVVLDLEKLDW
jgi:hypothetical protein